ncbi:MAG: CoB--CoM heterodisulfide reductase iron-sulfur subunit A family protein [Syntrophobacterales bacterium]|nr:CoB--CoM heterodisulfide reductase iron-sulfur subunit A family protein [Syntrophobacterales bacterium]
MTETTNRSILVVGGGISGLSAAIEAAEAGCQVYLVEKEAYLGGRVARMNKYFPKLCPPNCGLEINFRRIKNNPRVRFFTMAEVVKVSGSPGDFDVTIRVSPRYINEKCTACGKCEEAATSTFPNPFNYGIDLVKSVYLPADFCFPLRYVLNPTIIGTEEAEKIKAACPYNAVDLSMTPKEFDLKVSAIVWATGWRPYYAEKILYYGFGKNPDVITNVMMERYASPDGPTRGQIVRPSDGKPVEKVAFIQCAGSRDENHLPYCSGICCLASLKQATYVLDQNPEARVFIYYIDIRALGRYEDFFVKVQSDPRVTLIKGKAGEIQRLSSGKSVVQAEDQINGIITKEEFDLVVLATGMVPSTVDGELPVAVARDSNGFLLDSDGTGIIAAGCVKQPVDVATSVQDATAAALRALQFTVRR